MNLFNWFKKDKNTKSMNDLQLHVAGATVRHKGRFDNLTSYSNEKEITAEFIEKWTAPFYFELDEMDDEWIEYLITLKSEITDEVILTNLGDFNWRTRQTGAFFAAIKDKKEYTEIIGVHLLKSEVCYAGSEYAKVLVSFNTEQSISYLEKYLDYYLLQKDLYFDQGAVIQALYYCDKVNGTNKTEKHLKNWKDFIYDKKVAKLESIKELKEQEGNSELIKILEEEYAQFGSINTDWIEVEIETIERIKVS